MGLTEILLILGIALILFGPEDLPEIARTIGKIVFELRKATQDVTREFQGTIDTPRNAFNKAMDFSENMPETTPPQSPQETEKADADEELLTFEDENPADPLAELPSDMVSYEEKGASR
ncbi:Sec-independent protein secretion pathway component [Desulfosporosinus acidiphilus SJ4]|uniref:Sec-independent protein secretion pathway component n=1 Tax=Desulfosporosinus acidiphilus (strain DSM 22704 / JCM 16185 / SJ4) TaxID=646529 RepID=I4D528_DESAJ|nr:twin-arginine translocase TatA/TatE family subunit [Desulfosporosinus acidiphilus]AFM40902.1 Sec-independent protein secretion pathway component [Desulfosporosinus acidiphilus SJ4]